MVPSTYTAYFSAVATAAAALVGLLFVAISLRDETIFGSSARPEGEALAVTAFTGLVNAFTVAVLALVPGGNLGIVAVVLAVISIVTILQLNQRLRFARSPLLLAMTLAAYLAQLYCGIVLIIRPGDAGEIPYLGYIVFVTLVFALQRAWSLLRGRHFRAGPADGGPAARLASRTATAAEQPPPAGTE